MTRNMLIEIHPDGDVLLSGPRDVSVILHVISSNTGRILSNFEL